MMLKNQCINNKIENYVVLDEKLKVGYLPVPKAACTSMLNAFFSLKETVEQQRRLKRVEEKRKHTKVRKHNAVHVYQNIMFDRVVKKSKTTGYFVFSCVRHPVSRFLSFYKNKVYFGWDKGIADKLTSLGFYHKMSVDECIENLCSVQDPAALDAHVMPMSALLYYKGKLIPDYIMRVETLNNDWSYLMGLLGKSTVEVTIHNLSPKDSSSDFDLTQSQKNKLTEYYKDDMQLFGYR